MTSPFDDAYARHWRQICDQSPPDTEIVVVGGRISQQLPIHDRWWVTNGAALRMGTSFSTLGIGREAELSEVPPSQVVAFEETIDKYLRREIKESSEGRLSYSLFTLG